MATIASKDRMLTALDGLNPESATELGAALDEYERIKNLPERVGLCHNFAIGIIKGLHAENRSAGWTWARGLIRSREYLEEGGVDHSWVEYDGWGMDMGDDNEFRFWDVDAPPNFEFVGEPVRRDPAQTFAWLAAIDTVRGRLRLVDFEHSEVREAVVVVSGSPIPISVPRDEELHPLRAARIEASDEATGVRGVAYGFDHRLPPAERARVAALFPDHVAEWVQ